MKFAGQTSYLALSHQTATDYHIVKIYENRQDAIREWQASTRISPIFPLEYSNSSTPRAYSFPGTKHLLFVGPIHPRAVLGKVDANAYVWLSLGIHNCIIVTTDSNTVVNVLSMARKQNVSAEHWVLENAEVQKMNFCAASNDTSQQNQDIAKLSSESFPGEIAHAVQEYCPLAASTLARSAPLFTSVREDIEGAHKLHMEILQAAHSKTTKKKNHHYRILAESLTMNAALSRFSSQTFAGTIPIAETECHFWSHSFLGIGIPSIALRNITRFLRKTVSSYRLPSRVKALSRKQYTPDPLPNFQVEDCTLDILKVRPTDTSPLFPIISYFSARDGYHATTQTLSAPLAVIGSCNSLRWSLLTLTHEFSHVIIRVFLSYLYPDFEKETEITHLRAMYERSTKPKSLFEELQRFLLLAIINIAEKDQDSDEVTLGIESGNAELKDVLEKYRPDVDETMVHAFDFLYFYNKDQDKYVSGIWASWGTIPNIRTRVQDYVIRSVCAVSAKYIHLNSAGIDEARRRVRGALLKLQEDGLGGPYVADAVNLLDMRTAKNRKHWDNVLRPRIQARTELVRIVAAFLYSDRIKQDLQEERHAGSHVAGPGGYDLIWNNLNFSQIDNPLRFIEMYTRGKKPSEVESAWMWYVLAFGTDV